MSKFDDFFSTVLSGAKGLAADSLHDFLTQAQDDADSFLTKSKAQLHTWTVKLADGRMSKLEFEDLVGGLEDLAAMHALTEAGVAAARVQRFRDAVIKLVIDTAFKTFLP